MDVVASIGLGLAGSAAVLGLGALAAASIREREGRALVISLAATALVAAAVAWLLAAPVPVRTIAAVLGIAAWSPFVLPSLPDSNPSARPSRRVDERDIMFARARLVEGSPEYESYYSMRPQKRKVDDRIRSLPGLMSADARLADPVEFASAEDSFSRTEALSGQVDGPIAGQRRDVGPIEAAAALKQMAVDLGALAAGVAELRDYHVYTHVGRGPGRYGDPIDLDHGWAIAFTVEMDHRVMRTAPQAPVVAESARRYLDAAHIAVEVASAVREMGYSARAHIDGNYRVIAPLVAWDAGLGEIGRMGILMTPRLGPRVRIGVVTTSLPLNPDQPGDDPSILDFCRECEKCAENCPAKSIPFGDRTPLEGGGLRWALDAESCFRYWNVIGTDCGRCMSVCPYSHPDGAAHNAVRWFLQRSAAARRAGLALDDLFYGRHPKALPVEEL